MNYLTAAYYSLAVFAIIYEGIVIRSAEKVVGFYKRRNTLAKDDLETEHYFMDFMNVFYRFWIVIGFFSSQWLLFLTLILLGIYPKKAVWSYRIDAIVSFIILILIVLNKYHLHLTLQSFLNF